MKKPRIAIIGTGISGLTVARNFHSQAELTIYEASSWIGGHTNTIEVADGNRSLAVDTGFIVFNDRTYPEFNKLLSELDVPFQPAPMTFSVRCDRTNLEYRGADWRGLLAQKRNLLRPRFYRLLGGIVKFNKRGKELLDSDDETMTVKQFFASSDLPREFYDYYFLPMGSAIWSCPQSTFEDFPIRFIAEFYHHHGLLSINNRPQWRVVCGGSNQYVKPLVQPFVDRIRLNSPVHSVVRRENEVIIRSPERQESFDHVVFACHADQALQLLGDSATETEREVLGAFPYEPNQAVLHTDTSVLPKRRNAWASWNYLLADQPSAKASLTYCMNILQSIQSDQTWCVTLNNTDRIDPNKIVKVINYSHPIFDERRKRMQDRHHELIGPNRTSFCGAYWRNGFHEDGVVSGLRVVSSLRSSSDNGIQLQPDSAASLSV